MLSLFYFYYSDYNFEFLMVIDCISKLLLIAIMTINCRDYIFGSMASALVCWKEFYANIGVGIMLMLANLSAMLMINMSRFFVERYYLIEEFSVYFSFGLTLVNLGLMLTIGVSTVLYPALKKNYGREISKVVFRAHRCHNNGSIYFTLHILSYSLLRLKFSDRF